MARWIALSLLLLVAGCQTSEELATADDQQCRSYGAAPGSDAYIQCRMTIANQREADRRAYSRAIVAAQLSRPTPQPRQCTTIRVGSTLQTTCN